LRRSRLSAPRAPHDLPRAGRRRPPPRPRPPRPGARGLRHARRPLRGRVTTTLLRRPAPDDPLREATDPGDAGAATWVVGPEAALALAGRGVPGWRIAVRQEGRREVVLDALLRARAAYLRADPARLEEAGELCRLPAPP